MLKIDVNRIEKVNKYQDRTDTSSYSQNKAHKLGRFSRHFHDAILKGLFFDALGDVL